MKFKVGQNLKVIKENRIVKITDYEIFDDLILYYTLDKKAYPENELEKDIFSYVSSLVFNQSPKEFTDEEIENSISKLKDFEID
jgi:hypothetical protein